MSTSSTASFKFFDQASEVESLETQLLDGFSRTQKSIAPKFFYDERGSELFTEITRTEEYYPTRTEVSLLRDHGAQIADLIGKDATLLEYGSGSSEKIRLLLDSLKPKKYVPLDISRDYLVTAANAIAADYPWLEVNATCVDYSKDFTLPFPLQGNVAGFFPGSSIGNFDPTAALAFLKRVRLHLGEAGGLLIGVDLKKDTNILNRAYNDVAGITAAFNLNVLSHLNHAHQGNFHLSRFAHRASYNEASGCIQMFIQSLADQEISLAGQTFSLAAGEKIHTENSFKYSIDEFSEMCRRAGFRQQRYWTDENQWFSVFYIS